MEYLEYFSAINRELMTVNGAHPLAIGTEMSCCPIGETTSPFIFAGQNLK